MVLMSDTKLWQDTCILISHSGIVHADTSHQCQT